MMQGMSQWAIEEKKMATDGVAASLNWKHSFLRNNLMVASITTTHKSVYIRVWLFRPVTFKEYQVIDAFLKEYPSRGKNLIAGISNLEFTR